MGANDKEARSRQWYTKANKLLPFGVAIAAVLVAAAIGDYAANPGAFASFSDFLANKLLDPLLLLGAMLYCRHRVRQRLSGNH